MGRSGAKFGRWWGELAAASVLFSFIYVPTLRSEVRITVIRSSDSPAYDEAIHGFRASLSAQLIDAAEPRIFTLPANPAEAQALMKSINGQAPSLVLALGTAAARMARANVRSAPVLFCMVLETDGDLAYGGVSLSLSLTEYIEWIHRTMPSVKKVGVIYNPVRSHGLIKESEILSRSGVLAAIKAATPAEADKAVMVLKGQTDCLLLLPDPALFPVQTLGAFLSRAIEMGLPVVGVSPAYVKAGAIAAFFPDYRNNGELAGQAAARVIRGEAPRKIPVLSPTKVGSSFNMAIARHLNRAITEEAARAASDIVR